MIGETCLKGIILAGGTGSRLLPLTKVTNKHLLPVGNYPMVYHSIYKMKAAGICDVLLVVGKEHMGDFINLLGSGSSFQMQFTYKVQENAGGIAQALGLAEGFVAGGKSLVLLGDNIFSADLAPHIERYSAQEKGNMILIKRVENPSHFGVVEWRDGRVAAIHEKPINPPSSYCVTGIYMYDAQVFDMIRMLAPSKRGELEITDVNNLYIQKNQTALEELTGWWSDAGSLESYHYANRQAQSICLEELP